MKHANHRIIGGYILGVAAPIMNGELHVFVPLGQFYCRSHERTVYFHAMVVADFFVGLSHLVESEGAGTEFASKVYRRLVRIGGPDFMEYAFHQNPRKGSNALSSRWCAHLLKGYEQ
jgi:hypothetical protein